MKIKCSILFIFTFLFVCSCFQNRITDYKVLKGSVKKTKAPVFWKNYKTRNVIEAKETALIELPDNTTVSFKGKLALGKKKRDYGIIEGKAAFRVQKSEKLFQVKTRSGILMATEANFEMTVKELKPKKKNIKPGQNESKLTLLVKTGEAKFLGAGRKKAKKLEAGKSFYFKLGEREEEGVIEAIGFGYTRRKGRIGTMLRKRAAQAHLLRSLAEFKSGIKFVAKSKENTLYFDTFVFLVKSTIQTAGLQKKYQNFDKNTLLCVGKLRIQRENAEMRRICKKRTGEGSASLTLYPVIPKAFISARNSAILQIIQQEAFEIYGTKNPKEISGIFYPETLILKKEKAKVRAVVHGEVLLD